MRYALCAWSRGDEVPFYWQGGRGWTQDVQAAVHFPSVNAAEATSIALQAAGVIVRYPMNRRSFERTEAVEVPR